jgi:aminoglycoside 6-adenylyltransferase
LELYPPTAELQGAFSYLMQFMDGTRIDLILVPVENLHRFLDDSLCKLLLDKDDRADLKSLQAASDKSYLIERPSIRAFHDCSNEFWYTSAGLAKGIWRGQVPHVNHLFHNVVQSALMQVIDWHIGFRFQFSVSPGKHGRFYKEYLEPEFYTALVATYLTTGVDELWDSLFAAIELFQKIAQNVAEELGAAYPLPEHRHITEYLRHIRHLPKNAKKIY